MKLPKWIERKKVVQSLVNALCSTSTGKLAQGPLQPSLYSRVLVLLARVVEGPIAVFIALAV